jgi:uncharacterized membrane protein YidH (DUF202 family)
VIAVDGIFAWVGIMLVLFGVIAMYNNIMDIRKFYSRPWKINDRNKSYHKEKTKKWFKIATCMIVAGVAIACLKFVPGV